MMEDFLCDRLRALRNERGISAREMSLSIGQNDSYINKIETKQASPSMDAFFNICEYLDITPAQFFNTELKNTLTQDDEILKTFHALPVDQARHFLEIMKFVAYKQNNFLL